jgi:hypothetical protein
VAKGVSSLNLNQTGRSVAWVGVLFFFQNTQDMSFIRQ